MSKVCVAGNEVPDFDNFGKVPLTMKPVFEAAGVAEFMICGTRLLSIICLFLFLSTIVIGALNVT